MNKKDYFVENLRKVIKGEDLKREESFNCLKMLLDHEFGIANDSCFGALFAAMQTKGASIDEIAGLIDFMYKIMCRIRFMYRICLDIEDKKY